MNTANTDDNTNYIMESQVKLSKKRFYNKLTYV